MTDRYNALTVVLDRDIREDDAQSLIDAIQMLKGVRSVKPNVADISDHVAYIRALTEVQAKVWEALKEKA